MGGTPVPPLVGNKAPDFSAQAVYDQEFIDITLSQYRVRAPYPLPSPPLTPPHPARRRLTPLAHLSVRKAHQGEQTHEPIYAVCARRSSAQIGARSHNIAGI